MLKKQRKLYTVNSIGFLLVCFLSAYIIKNMRNGLQNLAVKLTRSIAILSLRYHGSEYLII